MINTTLRIEEELYQEIGKIAEDEQRSINAQIVYILKKFIEEKKEKEKKPIVLNNGF